MKAIGLVAGLLAVQAQYLDVPDFHHYLDSTAVETKKHGGVEVTRWNKLADGFSQETLNPPALHRLKIPDKGSVFPPKQTQYWLITPSTYAVTKGSITIKDKDGETIELTQGQLFYSPAAVLHGPIEAVSDDAEVLVLGEFPPRFDDVPAYIPTSNDEVTQHAFKPKDSDFANPGLPGFPECITIAGGPGAIAVKLPPHCELPYHFHPTGVFYFYTKGGLLVGGDYPDKNVFFPPGTSRWARPGWAYGPEASQDEESWFIALGEPPTTGPAPNVESFMIRNNLTRSAGSNALQPAYKNTQYGKGSKLSQKRARRHLRSSSKSTEDLDESILLQQPLAEDDLDSDDLEGEDLENEEL